MEGGLDVLQLWASWKDDSTAIDLGKKLAKLAERYSVPFVVNNDLEVALKIGADGVHIDGTEPSPSLIRRRIGEDTIVGVTCSTGMEKVPLGRQGKSRLHLLLLDVPFILGERVRYRADADG